MDYKDKYKAYFLKELLPKVGLVEKFDMEKVVDRFRKVYPQLHIYYPSYTGALRNALDELVSDGILKSELFSKKMTDGSKTETLYSWK